MTEITVGELLAKCLQAEGIEMMFGILDGAHIPLTSHAEQYGMRYINCRHEEGAVHLAEGYTRTKGKASVVIGSPGPGGANMLAGLSSAYAEGHPIIAIACTRRRLTTDPERSGAWQATDLVEMAKPITKYSAMIRQPERLPEMVRSAFRAALTGRPGPVFITIPDELLSSKIDDEKIPVYAPEHYRMVNMGAGDPDWIEQAAELLANAKKPYLHAGKGVQWAEASAEFVELGEYLGAGMGTSMGARGTVPEDHPHYFFLFDIQATSLARNEADVVLVVGSRLGEYDGWGMPPVWGMPEKQKTIQIDSDPNSIGINRPVDVGILADAKLALQAILSKVKQKTAARSEMPDLKRYRELSQQTIVDASQLLFAQPQRGLNSGQMVFNARAFFPRNAVTVLDGGNTTLWGVAFNQIYEPRSFLYSVKMGYLGTGIPFAIGAKLASPERPVYCITGDGAAGFNIMEMETAVRENVPIIVLVAVDDGWGMERSAHNVGDVPTERRHGVDISSQMRYDLIAQGMGCYAEKVDSVDALPASLQRAVDSGKPALLHVTVDIAINTEPPGYKLFRYTRTL